MVNLVLIAPAAAIAFAVYQALAPMVAQVSAVLATLPV